MLSHYICYFTDDPTDALIVMSVSEAIKAVREGAYFVAVVLPETGVWADTMEELAQIFYHSEGPTATFPLVFLDHLDNTQRGLVDSAQGIGE